MQERWMVYKNSTHRSSRDSTTNHGWKKKKEMAMQALWNSLNVKKKRMRKIVNERKNMGNGKWKDKDACSSHYPKYAYIFL